MKFVIKTFILFFIFLNTWTMDSIAQDTSVSIPKNQISIRHDNDFVLFTDRYYSTGLFLTYRRALSNGIFNIGKEQLNFEFRQQAFTPDNIDTEEVLKIDRPYAGFSGLTSGWSLARKSSFLHVKGLLGLVGPSSGAGAFQRWFHRNVVFVSVPTWFTEIENSFLANFEVDYAVEAILAPNPFGVRLAFQASGAYGSKDQYFQPQISAFLGRRSDIDSSIAYDQVGSTEREIYFNLHFEYRYVGKNALLEGNGVNDNSIYTIEPNSRVFRWGFGLYHRFNKNDYKFSYQFLAEEANEITRHQYLTISYGRSF